MVPYLLVTKSSSPSGGSETSVTEQARKGVSEEAREIDKTSPETKYKKYTTAEFAEKGRASCMDFTRGAKNVGPDEAFEALQIHLNRKGSGCQQPLLHQHSWLSGR